MIQITQLNTALIMRMQQANGHLMTSLVLINHSTYMSTMTTRQLTLKMPLVGQT